MNKVALEEVVSFFPDWKVPCLLFYSVSKVFFLVIVTKVIIKRFPLKKLEDMKVLPDVKSVVPITADVFKEDKSLAQKSEGLQRISFLPLVKRISNF